MSTTTHLALTLVDSAQAQKEITVNTALTRLDAILNAGAKDKDLATPPGSPAQGDVYIIAASPTGAWSGQAKAIAYYDQAWKFITPNEGMHLWVSDEDLIYVYNGSVWTAMGGQSCQAVTAAATTAIDVSQGSTVNLAQAVNITSFSFSNPSPSGTACNFRIIRTKDNSATTRTIVWPASVKWPSGSAPTLTQTANAVDIIEFLTTNAGSTWYGRAIGSNFS